MQRQTNIQQITNLTSAISNLASGSWLFLDLDDTLVLSGIDKYADTSRLTESGLAAELIRLRERGIKVIGLTARKDKYKDQTQQQLAMLGIVLDDIIHAPSKQLLKGQALQAYLELHAAHPQHIFVFDDDINQLQDIREHFHDASVTVHLKHYVAPQYQPINLYPDTNQLFPAKLDGFQKQRALGGGTNSVFSIAHPESRQQLVLKSGAHEDAAKIEMLCNVVYRALGVHVPEMRVYHSLPRKLARDLGMTRCDGMFQVSTEIKAHHEQSAKVISAAARQDFAAHVLLGNIDVAKPDNFIVDQQDKVWLIDAGANFMFRAKGAVRKEDKSLASEIDSLRNQQINERGHAWFAGLTDEEIEAQVTAVLAKHAEVEAAVWDASNHLQLPEEVRNQFLEYLSDRLDQLTVRFCRGSQRFAKTDKKARTGHTAAGILTYTMIDNEPHLLLSKRVGHEWWDNFGGKSEAGDSYLVDTARREVAEESTQMLNYTTSELLASPFHDIVTGTGRDQHVYRMYISAYHKIDLAELKDHEHTAHQYVPLKAVLAAVENEKRVTLEGRETVMVQGVNEELPLFPPLFHMLQQPEVCENLRTLQCTSQLKRARTLSYDDGRVHAQPNSVYRPLVTPEKKRQDITLALRNKSLFLREFKRTREQEPVDETVTRKAKQTLSQSEIHMKAVLAADYREGDLAANVRSFVVKHHGYIKEDNDRERLIEKCIALIETEKAGSDDTVYFYHACNNEIAFVYDVYTALYQALHANEQWAAFRPDSEHFKKFADINAFIAFYSEQGKVKINNNAKNYNDCALSANVFLFGNHEIATSNSIHYLVGNEVRRGVDLTALFTNILRPFRMSAEEIQRLLTVFTMRAKNYSGNLYQISMPAEQARTMSYPAKTMGVLKEFQGSRDLALILKTLQTQDLSSAQTLKFVSQLQARLMVPPLLRLNVKAVKWREIPADDEAAYQRELQQCVGYIFDIMLRHHGAFHEFNSNTAMIKVLPDILATNQLSLTSNMSDAVLARAILTNDAESVRNILRIFPEFKSREISFPHEYIGDAFGVPQQNEVRMTPIQMILSHSTLPFEIITEAYGERWFEAVGAIKVEEIEDLMALLRKLPENDRAELLCRAEVVLADPRYLWDVINMLLPDRRVAFVTRHLDVMLKHSFPPKYFADIVDMLPPETRLGFVNAHLDRIEIGDAFAKVMHTLAKDDRLAFATQHADLIRDAYDLGSVVGALPAQQRYAFAVQYRHLFVTSLYLHCLIEKLNQFERANYLAQMNDDLFVNENLSNLVRQLDEEECLPFLSRFDNNFFDDGVKLYYSAQYLKPQDRLTFINKHQGAIKDGRDLAHLLFALYECDRTAFAVKFQDKIEGSVHLENIIRSLPDADRLPFAIHHQMKIKTYYQLSCVLRVLREEDRFAFAASNLTRLDGTGNLTWILSLLPTDRQMEFAAANIAHIKDVNELNIVLNYIAIEKDCFALAVIKLAADPSADELSTLMRHCGEGYRVQFSLLAQPILKTVDQLRVIVGFLPYPARLDYVKTNSALITTSSDLGDLLLNLSQVDRLTLVSLHENLIKTEGDFMNIFYAIPEDQRATFALSHQHFQKRDGSAPRFFSPFPQVMQRERQDAQNAMIVRLIQRGNN